MNDEKLMRFALEELLEAHKNSDIYPTIIRDLRARLDQVEPDDEDKYAAPVSRTLLECSRCGKFIL